MSTKLANSNQPMISINQVSKFFGDFRALDNVSLTVDRGEVLMIVGPSGSGKSTLLKMLAGIEAPDTGEIRLAERLLNPLPAHQREIVLLFQQPYLFPFLSVGENIGFGLKARKVAKNWLSKKWRNF